MIALPIQSTPDLLDTPIGRRSSPSTAGRGRRPARRPDYNSMSIPELCRVILDADTPRPRLVEGP